MMMWPNTIFIQQIKKPKPCTILHIDKTGKNERNVVFSTFLECPQMSGVAHGLGKLTKVEVSWTNCQAFFYFCFAFNRTSRAVCLC